MKGALIGQGRTAEIYAWGDKQVLKLFFPSMPESAVYHEGRVSRLVYEAGASAPAVGAEVVEVDGRKGLIFERIDGESVFSLTGKKPWTLVSLARQMADLHAAMHRLTSAELPAQSDWLRHRIQKAPRLTEPLKRRALEVLDTLPPGEAICHGDYHPDNVVLTARGPVVLDWTNAVRGNPLGDVARTSLMLSAGGLPSQVSAARRLLARFARQFFHDVYLRRYCQQSGISPESVRAWMPVVAAARLNEGVAEEENYLVTLVERTL